MKLDCRQCGGRMKKKTIVSGNAKGCLLGLILIAVGIALCFIPILGWVLGPAVMLYGLFCGGKRRKVWRCKSCRAIVDRA